MAFRFAVAALVVLGSTSPLVTSCHVFEPENKPIDACKKNCAEIAARSCSEVECGRGCEFILDRIVERESKNVLYCVARTPRRCTDVVWADCAAHIGFHADGGPPGPPPPHEDNESQE